MSYSRSTAISRLSVFQQGHSEGTVPPAILTDKINHRRLLSPNRESCECRSFPGEYFREGTVGGQGSLRFKWDALRLAGWTDDTGSKHV